MSMKIQFDEIGLLYLGDQLAIALYLNSKCVANLAIPEALPAGAELLIKMQGEVDGRFIHQPAVRNYVS